MQMMRESLKGGRHTLVTYYKKVPMVRRIIIKTERCNLMRKWGRGCRLQSRKWKQP